jgi:DNA-binding CsgD family transcriptional regulator
MCKLIKLQGECEKMPGVKGSNRAAISKRQHAVLRYHLRGLNAEEIAKATGFDVSTIYRDIEAVRERLSEKIVASDLYGLQRAFAELDEEWREAWALYERPQPKRLTKSGKAILIDDSAIKAMILTRIHDVIVERARLCGFYSPKVMERITMVESAAGRGIQIERIPWDEQLRHGVEELKNNEGLARSQGIIDQGFSEGRPV